MAAALPAHADVKRATFSAAEGTRISDDLAAKLEQAIGRIPNAPTTAGQQRRDQNRAVQLANELLRSEGYYGGIVEARRQPDSDQSYAVHLIISPGPQFVIRDAEVEWVAPRSGLPRLSDTPSPDTFSPDSSSVSDEGDPFIEIAEPDTGEIGAVLPTSGTTTIVPIRGTPPVRPGMDVAKLAIEAMALPNGAPGRAADVIAAEARVVNSLQRNGFADARADPRYVEVFYPDLALPDDPRNNTVHPQFNIVAHDLVYLDGQITLNPERPSLTRNADGDDIDDDTPPESPTRTRQDWVQALVPWKQGDIYNPEDLALLERRLTETGVYNSANVSLAPLPFGRRAQTAEDNLRDVYVYLVDRQHKLIEAGASYATDDGIGFDIFRSDFNRFGRADTLRYGLRIASIDSRLGGEWSRPHFRRPGRTLKTSAWAIKESTDAYDREALSVDAEITQRLWKDSSMSLGIGIDGGRYKETRYDPVTSQALVMDRNLVLATLRMGAYIDRSNDPLNSTRGWRARVSAQPTAVTGEDTVFFLRGTAEASTYHPVGPRERTILAGRLKLGSIIGGDELTVPADRLMYAGGGGSVRGYSYQGINPRLPNGTPRGGLSLFESSLEVRHDIGTKYQAVVFLDGGSIGFHETPTLSNMRYGAGVGVRYFLPFGPIRADIAVPLNKREGDSDFQLYISIGQAF